MKSCFERCENFPFRYASSKSLQDLRLDTTLQLDSLNGEINKVKIDMTQLESYLYFYHPSSTVRLIYDILTPSFEELPLKCHQLFAS